MKTFLNREALANVFEQRDCRAALAMTHRAESVKQKDGGIRMYYNMFFRFMLIVVIIAGMCISSGCSQENELKKKMEAERVLKEQEEKREEIRARLREQIRKEQEKRNPKSTVGIEGDKQMEKKHRADAESCMKEFQRCTDACANSRCEDECLRLLSICERNLPTEFQTLKGD